MPNSIPAEAPPADAEATLFLRWAAGFLPGDTPRLDAEVMLAHALSMERMAMLLHRPAIGADARRAFLDMVARRQRREPVALICGVREFWSLELEVTPATLVPRPETETLVEMALGLFPDGAGLVLDLGTGSGALLLAVLSEWKDAKGVAVDRSLAALRVAQRNARRLGLADRVSFLCGDWADALAAAFDLILCNPPYVEEGERLAPELAYEPPTALFAGYDGLDEYRRIVPRLARLLRPDGHAVLEIGKGQEGAVGAIASEAGLSVSYGKDLAGVVRALVLSRETGLGKQETTV